MKKIQWNIDKNEKLKEERGISFDEVLVLIENKKILDIKKHPSNKYKHQMIFVIEFDKYIYYIPYVENKKEIFLKTIIPSRQLTKEYLKEKQNE